MPRERPQPEGPGGRPILPRRERTGANVTGSGRPRSDDEQLFTDALMEQFDLEMERRGWIVRDLAYALQVDPSLLSMYRSGQRIPSIPGFIAIDKVFPGLPLRVWQGYYRRIRERDQAEHGSEGDDDRELGGPPAERVGVHDLSTLLAQR